MTAFLFGALPLALAAQVRRPDSAPVRPGATIKPKHRTELIIGGGTVALNKVNATQASAVIASVGFRRQLSPAWLNVGAVFDYGGTSIDGEYFPYEKRVTGDTTLFTAVGGKATILAGRLTVDAMFPLDEEKRFSAGIGANVGMYSVTPTPAGGAGAGSFVAPTFGFAVTGLADITSRLGLTATAGYNQFTGFDRDKLRPSNPALEDPVFLTPLLEPPAPVKSVGGIRATVGLTYRFGVKTFSRGAGK